MNTSTVMLPLEQILMDGGTQPRSVLNLDTVDDYADAMLAGAKFPPVTVYYDGQSYWLSDGFHRVRAAWQDSIEEIEAEVIQGTLDDAKWHSFGANQKHGLRRTNDDKHRAVQAALAHPKSTGLSNCQIAKHVGVSDHCVGDWRAKLSPKVSEMNNTATRTVTRQGTTYQQNTTNIGRKKTAVSKEDLVKPEQPIYSMPARRRVRLTRAVLKSQMAQMARAFEKGGNPDIEGVRFVRVNGVITDVEIITVDKAATA